MTRSAKGLVSQALTAGSRLRGHRSVARFAANQVIQGRLQESSIRSGKLRCKPTAVYVALTSACDCRCAMCDMWRREPIAELPTAIWTETLMEMRRWLGPYHVNFNGGEPYLREDFNRILRFCGEHGILAGFVTNAIHMDRAIARETIEANPFNISISLDGMAARTHDALRGHEGAHAKVMRAIDHLCEFREQLGARSKIIIKPTVMKKNLAELPEMARWVEGRGDLLLYLQPVIPWWSTGSKNQFGVDLGLLDGVVDELLDAREGGAPILNSPDHLRSFKPYFRDATLPDVARGVCHVGVKNFFIHPDGDVFLCEHEFDAVGNITRDTPADIWRSRRAEATRAQVLSCHEPCLQTCIVKRSLADNVDMFRNLVLR